MPPRRGVDVKIVLPGNTDSSLPLSAGRYYYSGLLKSGVKLYERHDVLLHAKTAVIDNVWSTVGSTNMDFWSFSINDEVNAVILSKEFAAEMEKMFATDLAESDEIRLEEWKKRPVVDKIKEWIAHQFRTLVVIDRRGMLKKPLSRRLSAIVPMVVIAAILCGEGSSRADVVPQPPCGSAPFPPYPDLENSPAVRAWDRAESGRDWTPPACTGWTDPGFTTLVAVAARFRQASGAEDLLRRIGAISGHAGIRYWSTTHKRWQTLIIDVPRLVGCDRRSAPGRLLPRRDDGRQESLLSAGG